MVTKLSMSTNFHVRDCKRQISQCSLTSFSMLAILIICMSTGVIELAVPMESALLLGQALTAAFHLNHSETKRELNVYNNANLLPPCPVPSYLGVKLDR